MKKNDYYEIDMKKKTIIKLALGYSRYIQTKANEYDHQ